MRDIRLKKIWKCLGIATIIPTTITTACCLSACNKEDKKLDNIKIVSKVNDLQVNLGESLKSSSIIAKGYDQSGQEITGLKLKIILSDESGLQLPSWLTVNDKNQICISNLNNAGSWKIHIQAIDEESRVKSDFKSINITVLDPKLIPDSLKIDCADSFVVLAPIIKHVPIGLIAYKNNHISYECIKKCDWQITNVECLDEPDIEAEFFLEDYGSAASLYVDPRYDVGIDARYNITIEARSALDDSIVATKTISVQVACGWYFIDTENNYCYRRELDEDATWSLVYVPEGIDELAGVRSEIWGIPVTEVAENLCALTPFDTGNLFSVTLPESITKIGSHAFIYQNQLKLVSMPGVKEVGDNAFRECNQMKLSQATPQPRLEILGDYAFFNCLLLTLDVPQPLKSIGKLAFHLTGITELTIDADLETIGDLGFGEVNYLTKLTVLDETPAFCEGDLFSFYGGGLKIYVPSNSITLYKNAAGWSDHATKIVGI